jgi:cysteinyl-tRNA synthetase
MFLYNSKTRQKQPFRPLDPQHVKMYVCGPTVYNHIHIGNARPLVVFDLLYRLLKHHFPRVTYARNITDVDDKIIRAAQENSESIHSLTQRMTRDFLEHSQALNTLMPDIQPKATEHIQGMIDLIELLLESGFAYVQERHVLFDVSKDLKYGLLSGRSLDEMQAGKRIKIETYKRGPYDFVLWKPAQEHEVGWQSPWGYGRPGWHIECSAMIREKLGSGIDIHGGGIDLVFPHHENESAQSRCALGTSDLASYWVHNGLLQLNSEKMSKSAGNFFTLHEKLQEYPGELIRYVLLSTHYRQPLDWTDERVSQCRQALNKFYQALEGMDEAVGDQTQQVDPTVLEALGDDLNTPAAFARLHELASQILKEKNTAYKKSLQAVLRITGLFLGFFSVSPRAWFQDLKGLKISETEIESAIIKRQQAKKEKAYEQADEIRSQLLKEGIILEDSPQGTQWRRQ